MLEIERKGFGDETKRKGEGIGSEETKRRCSKGERENKSREWRGSEEKERKRRDGKREGKVLMLWDSDGLKGDQKIWTLLLL